MTALAPTELLKLADPVENVAASEDNPIKHGLFVRYVDTKFAEYANELGCHATPIDNLRLRQAASVGAEVAGEAVDVRSAFEALSLWVTAERQKYRVAGGMPADGFDNMTPIEIALAKVEGEIDRRALASPSRSEGVSKGEVQSETPESIRIELDSCRHAVSTIEGNRTYSRTQNNNLSFYKGKVAGLEFALKAIPTLAQASPQSVNIGAYIDDNTEDL